MRESSKSGSFPFKAKQEASSKQHEDKKQKRQKPTAAPYKEGTEAKSKSPTTLNHPSQHLNKSPHDAIRNLRLQLSDGHPKLSDGHPKLLYVHPKLMNGDFRLLNR